nr:hypothetical protein CFP56_72384 [Quercus suber]
MCGGPPVLDHADDDHENEHPECEHQMTTQVDDPSIRADDEISTSNLDMQAVPPAAVSGQNEKKTLLSGSSHFTTLEAAKADDVASNLDDLNEDIIPSMSSRTGTCEDKLRALCLRHDLSYQSLRRWPTEPPRKIRRVEKPIKIKMYWNCHECKAVLGRERTCKQCGHSRCSECSKTPAARVTQLLAAAKQSQEQGEDEERSANVLGQESTTGKDGQKPQPHAISPASQVVSAILKQDDETGQVESAALLEQHRQRLALHVRPRTSEELMLRPKVQIIRRSCHACDTPFTPANRTDCSNCGHERCTMCPRWPAKTDKWPLGSPGDEKASPTPTNVVQRVYKKPRLRVRYTCERCDAVFTERNVCTNCGHSRCNDCRRYPPLKSSPTPASAPSLSVAHRLEAHDRNHASPDAATPGPAEGQSPPPPFPTSA